MAILPLSARAPVKPVKPASPEIAGIMRIARSLTSKGQAHQKILDKLDQHRVAIVNTAIQQLAKSVKASVAELEKQEESHGKIRKTLGGIKKSIDDSSANSVPTAKVKWVGENWTLVIHNVQQALEDRNADAEFTKDDADGGSEWDKDEKPLLRFSGRFRKRIYMNVLRNKAHFDKRRDRAVQMEGRELDGIGKHFYDKLKASAELAAKQSEILEKEGLPKHPLLAAAKRLEGIKVHSTHDRYYKMIWKAISPSAWYKKLMTAATEHVNKEHANVFTGAELSFMAAGDHFTDLWTPTSKLPSTLKARNAMSSELAASDLGEGEEVWSLEIVQTRDVGESAAVDSIREMIIIREVCSIVQGAHKLPISAQESPTQRVTLFLCEDELSSGEISMLQKILSSKTAVDVSVSLSRIC